MLVCVCVCRVAARVKQFTSQRHAKASSWQAKQQEMPRIPYRAWASSHNTALRRRVFIPLNSDSRISSPIDLINTVDVEHERCQHTGGSPYTGVHAGEDVQSFAQISSEKNKALSQLPVPPFIKVA